MSDSHLFGASPDICVRLPRSYIPDVSHVSVNDDETPRIGSNGSYHWGVQYPSRPQDFATFDTFVAPLESQETRPNHTFETQATVECASRYTSVPLQQRDANLSVEHGFPTLPLSEFPLNHGHSYSEPPSSASYWTAGSDSGYNILHDLHNVPYATHTSIYDVPFADAISFNQAPPTQSQATSLLAILNASAAPYIPLSLRCENETSVSSSEDPPLVKLAPIGHPTARPTRSSYCWPRFEPPDNALSNPSPLCLPHAPTCSDENQILSWPPVLSGPRS